MQTITVLNKIHEDLELLKREVLEIKTAIEGFEKGAVGHSKSLANPSREDIGFAYIGFVNLSISLEPELKSRVKRQVEEARKRMAAGEFVSNKDVLKEFDLE